MVIDWDDIAGNIGKFKDLTSLGVTNFFGAIALSVFWLYIASLVGVEGYGNLGFLLATAGIVGTVALLGSSQTLVVYRAKDVRIESTIFLIVIVSAMIASLTTFLFLNSSEVSIYIFGFAMFSLLINESLGKKNYRKYSWCFFSQRILAIILSLTLYHIIGIEGIILGYAFSFFPFFIFIYKTLRDVPINFTLLRPRSGFMMTSYAITMLHSLGIRLDKLIILPLFGAALLGNYFLGFQIFYSLLLISSTVFQYVLPEDSSGISHIKLKKFTILLSLLLSVIIVILAPIILPLLFPDFTESVLIVQIMSIAIAPSSISLMLISKFLADEKIKIVIIGKIIELASMIAGIFGLGSLFGIIGAAIAFSISAILATIYFFIVQKLLKN